MNQLRFSVLTSLSALVLAAGARAQHPPVIAVNNPESAVFEAKISPNGLFVAYTSGFVNNGVFETRLGFRLSNGASASTTVVHSEFSTAGQPQLSFTWRFVGPNDVLMFVDSADATNPSATLLQEFDPLAPGVVTRAQGPPQAVWTLQMHPCGSVLAGAEGPALWSIDFAGAANFVLHLPTIHSLNALPIDVDPVNNDLVLFQRNNSGTLTHFTFSRGTGQITPLLASSGPLGLFGFIDNQTQYGTTTLSPAKVFRNGPGGMSDVTRTQTTIVEGLAWVEPAHLGGSSTKNFLALVGRDNNMSTSRHIVRLNPVVYGGTIDLFDRDFPFVVGVRQATVDRASANVAFISQNIVGFDQVLVAPTNREIVATFLHPPGAQSVVFTETAPCAANESCFLFMDFGLAPTPTPWGPPGTGQIDLSPSSAIFLAAVVNGPTTAIPVTHTFSVPVSSFAVGQPVFFQAIRESTPFPGTGRNTTRPARVLMF